MKASEATLRRFVADTGVNAIMGYQRDVGWIESAQLELGLLAWLARRPIANGKPLGEALVAADKSYLPPRARFGSPAAMPKSRDFN